MKNREEQVWASDRKREKEKEPMRDRMTTIDSLFSVSLTHHS